MVYKHYKLIKRKRNYNFFNYLFYRYHRIFFGSLIFKGRKLWAFNIFFRLKYNIKIKEGVEPNLLFFYSMLNISPTVLLFPLKIGGKVQGVPLSISISKKLIFATKWVIKLLKDKYKRVGLNDLIDIIISACYNKGLAIKKKSQFKSISSPNRFLIKYFK